jgi:hypothetical protein
MKKLLCSLFALVAGQLSAQTRGSPLKGVTAFPNPQATGVAVTKTGLARGARIPAGLRADLF